MRALVRIGFILALTLGLLAAANATSAANSGPTDACRPNPCEAHLKVAKRARFVTPEVFYPNNEQLVTRLFVGRRELPIRRTYGAGECKQVFKGGGVRAKVRVCGSRTPLSVRASRSKRARKRVVRISYRALPYMLQGDL